MASLWLLLLGMPCFLFATTTYRLKRVASVKDGGKYVFEQSGRVMTRTIASNALQTTASFSQTGLLGSEAYVWELTANGNGYKMKNASGNFLKNSSSTSLAMGSSSDATVWSFNFQEDGTVLIQKTGNNNSYLGYMGATDYLYKVYSTDWTYPHNISVYQLVEESESPKNPALQFSNTLAVAVMGITFTSPVLSKDENFKGNVTYSSSNTNVATVDSEGNVTLVGPGMAKITASTLATEDYHADETFYSLRVFDGDGTIAHPFSLRDIFTNTFDTSQPFYLTGYVVGSYITGSEVSATAADDETLAIADAKDETTLSKMKMVYLEGDRQSTYGLKSHPDMIGNRIVVRGKDLTYMSNTAVGNVTSLTATRDITISAVHLATVGATYSLDFSGKDVHPYKASIDRSWVKLERITDDIVPANQGTIVYSETPGTYAIPVTTASGTIGDTGLEISDGTTAMGDNIYILANRNGNVAFFRWAEGYSLAKGRVYLNTGTLAPAFLSIDFASNEDETTSIDNLSPALPDGEGTVYDLSGRRVANTAHAATTLKKGLYIVNGRKVVVR